jgi:16S rRNA (adenine1518-N6/adenine1519-N6)-dimethyltransferase
MGKAELLAVLAELGIRPSRRLGQNFMVDGNLLRALVSDADPRPGQLILEVGPGTGVLTRELLATGCRVVAVELDLRLAEYLRRRFAGCPGLTLVAGDACRQDYAALMPPPTPFRCVANLPYSCSSAFLARMSELEHGPADMHVMLQREMAERLGAAPGTKDYSALTVRVGLRYRATVLRRVPPQVFFPPPDVASAFVHFERCAPTSEPDVARLACELARLCFRHRRKKAMHGLSARVGREHLEAAFACAGLPPDVRAEAIDIPAFVRLAACLRPHWAPYSPDHGSCEDQR